MITQPPGPRRPGPPATTAAPCCPAGGGAGPAGADPLAALRAATTDLHRRVEQGTGVGDGALDVGRYRSFLLGLARLVPPVEAAVDEVDAAGDLGLDWPRRRKADLLRRDLADLGLEPPAPAALPALGCPHAALGALYVTEGSTLGSVVVGRMVRHHLGPDAPVRYLSAYGGDVTTRWAAYRRVARRRLAGTGPTATAITTATAVFGCARQVLAT